MRSSQIALVTRRCRIVAGVKAVCRAVVAFDCFVASNAIAPEREKEILLGSNRHSSHREFADDIVERARVRMERIAATILPTAARRSPEFVGRCEVVDRRDFTDVDSFYRFDWRDCVGFAHCSAHGSRLLCVLHAGVFCFYRAQQASVSQLLFRSFRYAVLHVSDFLQRRFAIGIRFGASLTLMSLFNPSSSLMLSLMLGVRNQCLS